jgi:hypothetical protein
VRREREGWGRAAENNLSGLFTQIQNPITHTDKFFFILRNRESRLRAISR